MKPDQELERLFQQEFKYITPNLIWQNENGEYEVFGKYKIIPGNRQYRVVADMDDNIGIFSQTRTALSWCIADKYKQYNLARELLLVDQKLSSLAHDISARTAIGEKSRKTEFREIVGTKLETKIIHKKQLENQLAKCVNSAKYWQQRGFNNETARTGRGQPNKTNR
jgi:hypothetical protein